MARCSFCGHMMTPGTGKLYVKNDGKVLYFCSRKCEKYATTIGRRASALKWTSVSQKKRISNK